ncbi:MAG TPA: lytic transglycosylase domain-containing protein [Puia sp.]|nr:lytic transglycosylase domain-containing protein [Puia sp.]
MLKSLVHVTLCGILIFSFLQATAGSRGWDLPAAGSSRGWGVPVRQVQKFVDAYIKNNDAELAQVRERSVQPFTIIDSVMEHYDLPQELRYLAVIESELVPTALSRVGARGPWQLMAGTARDLGLKVSRRSDERINYYKSTWAAALYLRDLHREFKDWLLVLAAYNAGPAPVYRAIRLAGSRNFWALERYLPGETRRHIRRFIATEYYFANSGPVVDPVPVGPAGLQQGFPGGVAGMVLPGAGGMGTGLSDGVSEDISGVVAVSDGTAEAVGGGGMTGVAVSAWRRSEGVWRDGGSGTGDPVRRIVGSGYFYYN